MTGKADARSDAAPVSRSRGFASDRIHIGSEAEYAALCRRMGGPVEFVLDRPDVGIIFPGQWFLDGDSGICRHATLTVRATAERQLHRINPRLIGHGPVAQMGVA